MPSGLHEVQNLHLIGFYRFGQLLGWSLPSYYLYTGHAERAEGGEVEPDRLAC